MIAPRRFALAALGLFLVATAAVAQITPPPRPGAPGTEEPPPARIQLGPVGVRPALILREVGYEVMIGFDRIAYEARLDEPQVLDNQTDRARLAGGGIGIRLREEARLAPNYDHANRDSEVPTREYSRGRLYATLNYGF